jgi:hypothetical protein
MLHPTTGLRCTLVICAPLRQSGKQFKTMPAPINRDKMCKVEEKKTLTRWLVSTTWYSVFWSKSSNKETKEIRCYIALKWQNKMVEMSARNFCGENSCPLFTAVLAVQPVKLCRLAVHCCGHKICYSLQFRGTYDRHYFSVTVPLTHIYRCSCKM